MAFAALGAAAGALMIFGPLISGGSEAQDQIPELHKALDKLKTENDKMLDKFRNINMDQANLFQDLTDYSAESLSSYQILKVQLKLR